MREDEFLDIEPEFGDVAYIFPHSGSGPFIAKCIEDTDGVKLWQSGSNFWTICGVKEWLLIPEQEWRRDEPETGQIAEIIDEDGKHAIAICEHFNDKIWESGDRWWLLNQVKSWLPMVAPEEIRLRRELRKIKAERDNLLKILYGQPCHKMTLGEEYEKETINFENHWYEREGPHPLESMFLSIEKGGEASVEKGGSDARS